MPNTRSIAWVMAVGLCLHFPVVGSADFAYQLADSMGVPTTSFTLSAVGEVVDLRVYLVEFGSPGNILATDGLFSVSVRIEYGSPPGVVTVAGILDVQPTSTFVNLEPPPSQDALQAGFTGDVGFDPFLFPDVDTRIFLGTFRLTGLSSGTVPISVGDREAGVDDTLTGLGVVLDGQISSAAGAIVVAAVPEPATMGLGVLAAFTGAGLCFFRKRTLGLPSESTLDTDPLAD